MSVGRLPRQCEFPGCPPRKHFWRVWREAPHGLFLDGHWYCSPECFKQALVSALGPLLTVTPPAPVAPNRVPLGLLMLDRGFVDREQLRRALQAQKDSGTGRVGEWLRHMGAATEDQVTQVLGLQWSMPVFPLRQTRRYLECAHLIPLVLLEAVEMVPVHYLETSQQLFIAFVDRVNYTALYAVEKVLECHTEPCLAPQSLIQQALKELRGQALPGEIVVEVGPEPPRIADTTWTYASKLAAEGVRVSGFAGFVWVRIVSASGPNDLLFRIHYNQTDSPPRLSDDE